MVCEETPEDKLTEQREQYLSSLKYCRVVTEEDYSQLWYTYCEQDEFEQYPDY